jgi:hypothetical protein
MYSHSCATDSDRNGRKKKKVENNTAFTHIAPFSFFGRGNFGSRCPNADLAMVHTRNISTAMNQY